MKGLKTTVSALSLLMVASLASCGGGAKDVELDENWEGSITWWHTYQEDPTPEDDSDNGNYALYYYAKGVADAFMKDNPKIKVKLVFKGSKQNDYFGVAQEVAKGIPTGDVPNMVTTYGTYVYGWAKDGAVADVSAHAEKLKADGDYNKGYLDSEINQYGNKYYSLPYSKSAEALMLNTEVMMAKAGEAAGEDAGNYKAPVAGDKKAAYGAVTSFEGLMEMARTMKEDYPDVFANQKKDGNFEAVPVIYEDAANMFITLLESKGIPFVTNDENPVNALKFVNDQRAKDLAVTLTKWNHEGLLATKNNLRMSGQYHDYPSNLFAEGKCFAIIASTTGAPWMANDGYSVSWNEVPKYDASSAQKVISQGPSLAFFNKKDKNELAASLKFYDYLTNKANTAALAVKTNYFPVRKSAMEDSSVKALRDAAKKDITYATAYADKKSAYGGKVFDLDEAYNKNGNYFMSPVFSLSDKARTAANNLITALFDDTSATTDEQIKTLVENQFAAAKKYVLE